MLNYRSVHALARGIPAWSDTLPWDIDVIVGVPRSGLLVGSLLALHRNLPLTDVEGLLAGRLIAGGKRCPARAAPDLLDERRKVLVVEDVVASGTALHDVQAHIAKHAPPHEILYGAAYVGPGMESELDTWLEVVELPLVFEWNVMYSRFLERSCVDIDGVLCRDPTPEEDDDGPRYREFLTTVEPRVIPQTTVGWLVTSRLEQYRGPTEEWLARHGIRYHELVMLDLPDKASREALPSQAPFKADVYRRNVADLFIESSVRLSREIARLTGWQVLCTRTGEMVQPSPVARRVRRAQRVLNRLLGRSR